jgi:quaternary ammonium compound-resistance protein SugE
MAWTVLLISGVLEAVWATALARSEGFSRPLPTAVFAVGIVLSMVGLAYALRTLPVGTGYAVWVGVGAALTAAWGMAFGGEEFSPLRVALLSGIVLCVAGLKLAH